MPFLNSLKHSIFLRIYAGLLLVCLCVALFAQLLIETINQERIQSYRESMASGAMSLVSSGLVEQPSATQRQYWLNDVSRLFGDKFALQSVDSLEFTASERKRIEQGKTVVRVANNSGFADIFQPITDENKVISVRISQVTEQKVRAIAILLLNDLSQYPTRELKQARLNEIGQQFSFPLMLDDVDRLGLDDDQLRRIRGNEVVILFRDSTRIDDSSIRVLAPTQVRDVAVVMGPVKLFKWFPFNLIISVVLISMFLISLGVYALIFPLERKLQLIQSGVNEVSDGNLDARVQLDGQDEIARLGATFNAMTQHIKRLIESQRELTRAVSHELRTPVARIRFAVDMLADTDDADSREMQKNFIDEDIESLNSLIDEILTYAKLEEGSPKLDMEAVNLKDLIDQIVRETNALGKPIEVVGNPPSAKVTAVADHRYLHRVIQNLAGNALRYADGKIIVSAGVRRGKAFVSVEDDGQGIPEADRDKVFIPFARLDDSRTRASGGYGLGLSIVSRIAFWFHGEMSVDESPELGGARFIMRWPAKPLTQTIVADTLTQEQSERKLIEEGSV